MQSLKLLRKQTETWMDNETACLPLVLPGKHAANACPICVTKTAISPTTGDPGWQISRKCEKGAGANDNW
ncbi:hypothetical protein Ciccas_004964 [Cichlidogyrus casuarinus]|uniref:Uncharacterized protein n=1 Tax=Cichlidogyrus casuarinus TaxID=1844966 RepID=A0ABD2QDI3_9PLAT